MSAEGTRTERVESSYLRQLDIIDPDHILPSTLIGAGAIGSGVGIVVGKMGIQILHIWDGDRIEEHNVPNQYFPNIMLGRNKAEALREVIEQYTPMDLLPMITSHPEHYTEDSPDITSEVVFVSVDSLEARREIFERLRRTEGLKWLIDGRMAAEYYQIYIINMEDEEEKDYYWSSLQGEPMEQPCTARSVIYNVMSVASDMVNMFKKIITGERLPIMMARDIRNYTIPWLKWRDR